MSNFQRTRSKVWWGDDPPNIGSPVAQPEWNRNNQREEDWEPQLPHWIANHADQHNNSADNVAQANPPNWPLRHGSPGSHKSQDSGFSDSDSSPPTSQYYPSPDSNESKNKSSSDSNNNENITVKQVIDFQTTPRACDEVDATKSRPRLRSSSVIQTPYDLQKYCEVHQDEEHIELFKDNSNATDQLNNTVPQVEPKRQHKNKENLVAEQKKSISKSYKHNIEINVIPPEIDTNDKENSPKSCAIDKKTKEIVEKNIISPSKKYPIKKDFVSSKDCTKLSKVALVKDLDTSTKLDKSLEYIKLSDNNEIAVNNQPRMRSPIANISYVPTERTIKNREFRRSISNEDKIPITNTPNFQRDRLNKSLNYEAQKLDQQILDIQEGHRSLGYIDENKITESKSVHQPTKALLGKNIMDSLNLRPMKKGLKTKPRILLKADKLKNNNTKPKHDVVETHAGGILTGSRVPFLGLPRATEHDSWVIVGYPEEEVLLNNYNERLIAAPGEAEIKPKGHEELRNVTPPPQFQDNQDNNNNLKHDTKREKLKDEFNFDDVQLNLACTSTPKMLKPREFLDVTQTPRSSKKSRTAVADNFDGLVLNNKDELLYRERSIDQTNLERLCARRPEPVQYWLCELVGSMENECMTTLQSKPLVADIKAKSANNASTITSNIKKVQIHGQIIVQQYSEVLRNIEANTLSEDQICLLMANINDFVLAHSITLNSKPPGETPDRWDKIKKSLQVYLQKLIDIGEDVKIELNESCPQLSVVERNLEKLIDIFLETTKAVLVQQMKTLVSLIEEPPSDNILKSTLTSIGHLAMLSEEIREPLHEKCSKIVKSITELPFVDCAVPRALLTVIIESSKSSVKALSLRALATVCASGDAVKQFEEGGGIEILSDIISDRTNPEPQIREAITVLTQITAPWLRGHYDLTQLHLYLDTIVDNITGILSRTECSQLLLLCTACLVNLVRELELEKSDNCQSDIVAILTKHKTVDRLLDAVKKRGQNISVFLQEQTASLLASLSRIPRSHLMLSSSQSVPCALVCFTRLAPSHQPREAELRAQARLHCHAAEGLSRLCLMPEVAQQIVQLEGVSHFVRLVRTLKSRNRHTSDPDQTLIYSLKALRTIYKYQPEAFVDRQKDVEEMIRPHLLESLMTFSGKKESYV